MTPEESPEGIDTVAAVSVFRDLARQDCRAAVAPFSPAEVRERFEALDLALWPYKLVGSCSTRPRDTEFTPRFLPIPRLLLERQQMGPSTVACTAPALSVGP